jgi:hypothetical protein
MNMKRLFKWALLSLVAFYVSLSTLYVFGKVYRLLKNGGFPEPLLESMQKSLYEWQIGCLVVLAVMWVFLDKAQKSFVALLVAITITSLSTFAFLNHTGHFYIKATAERYGD